MLYFMTNLLIFQNVPIFFIFNNFYIFTRIFIIMQLDSCKTNITFEKIYKIYNLGVGKCTCRRKCCKEARRISRALSKNRTQRNNTSLLHEIDACLVMAKGFLFGIRGLFGSIYV